VVPFSLKLTIQIHDLIMIVFHNNSRTIVVQYLKILNRKQVIFLEWQHPKTYFTCALRSMLAYMYSERVMPFSLKCNPTILLEKCDRWEKKYKQPK